MEKRVEKLDDFGRGIVKIDNKVCFVKNALKDEIVEVEIISNKKKYMVGRSSKIITKSNERITPKCKYYELCGGCNLSHMTFNEENNFKIEKVKNIFRKFAGLDIDIKKINYKDEYYYRNKIVLRVKNNKLCLLEENSNNYTPIDNCLLVNKKINEVISKLEELLKDENEIDKIMIRYSNYIDDVMIKVDGKVKNISSFKDICSSLIINDKVISNEFLICSILDKKFYVSSDSFFQVNYDVVNMLYKKIIDVVKNNNSRRVLDLYCGVGSIGICVSDYVDEVFGVEVVEKAIESASKNKELNKVSNISFKCGKVEDVINNDNVEYDTIILDPPRSGVDKKAITVLNNSGSNIIIYVSCDPITLARDVKLLNNYVVKEVEIFNMFPRTYHCESVCVLERR